MKRVCIKALEQSTTSKNEDERKKEVEHWINQFQTNSGILTARGQHLYGFLHLTLQEYYTCKNMVDIKPVRNRARKLVEVFEKHITDPRFRVPLTLALSWVGCEWEQDEIDAFFHRLFTLNNHLSQYFPLEILMFVTSIAELEQMPSKEHMFVAFTRVLSISAQNDWHINHPNLEKRVAIGLLKLSRSFIEEWIMEVLSSEDVTVELITALCTLMQECERVAQSEKSTEKKNILKGWANPDVCKLLTKYLRKDSIGNQFVIDAVLAQVAVSNSIALPSTDLQKFFSENPSCLTKLSLPMLAAVIALCGGLMMANNEQKGKKNIRYDYKHNMIISVKFAVVFSPHCMHRKSPLAPLLIEFIGTELSNKKEKKIRTDFIDRIQKDAKKLQPDDRSLKAIDTFILMFCIIGVDEIWLYKPFTEHTAFHRAIDRFKRICNYLRQFYFIPEIYDKYRGSVSSKHSLLSNYDSFNEHIYNQYTINRDSTQLIELFMTWYNLMDTGGQRRSSNDSESLFVFIDAISHGRARLCTSTRTSLSNKWICKTDQRVLLLPKFFQKQKNLQQLLNYSSTKATLSFPMFLRTLWMFDDYRHGDDMSEVTIEKAECSMILAYDRNHSFALAFVQKHLQLLFSRAMNKKHILIKSQGEDQASTVKSGYNLSFAHVLCHSLLSICNYPVTFACQSVLITLLPLARIYRLKSLVLALLWWTTTQSEHDPDAVKWYFEEMQRPTDSNKFSYTDGYDKLTKVERVQISDQQVDDGLKNAINSETNRLRDALKLLKSKDSKTKANMEIFSSSICLGFLCWAIPSGEGASLFNEAMTAASKISDPLVRLDVLNVLAFCPALRFSKKSSENLTPLRASLNVFLEPAFSELPSDLTPLLSVFLLSQYISVMGADDKCIERITLILDQTDRIKDEDDRRAICIALGPYVTLSPDLPPRLYRLMQQFHSSSVLTRTQILQFDSPALRYFVEGSTEHETSSLPFLNNINHSESVSVLYASLYLANLASDVQKLSVWLTDNQQMKLNVSTILNWQLDRSEQKRILTYSHVVAIENKLKSLNNSESTSDELTSLEKELHTFQECEPSSATFIKKWLKYTNDSPRYTLACHAALILTRSGIWTKNCATILCDLLQSDNDRFRQEVERLLYQKERKSSELGWDVLLTFIERLIWYETKSTHVSLVLTWLFENITIDNVEHLDSIYEWEIQRIEVNTDQKKSTKNRNIPAEQLDLIKKSPPIPRWFTHIAPNLMEHFTGYLRSFIQTFSDSQNIDQPKYKFHKRFIFGWCAQVLAVDTNKIDEILKVLVKILKGAYSADLQRSAAFAMGHSGKPEVRNVLLEFIENSIKEKVAISNLVLAMCIRAYCWSCCSHKKKIVKKEEKSNNNDNDDDDKDKEEKHDEAEASRESLCKKMLKHGSEKVSKSASAELAKVCPKVENLLGFFENDYERCYRSLIDVIIDPSYTDACEKHAKCLVRLIKTHIDLLKIFTTELCDSLKEFDDGIHPYPDWSEHFPDFSLIPIACVLVEDMPLAFFSDGEESVDVETLKKALLNVSGQHDYFRQNACIRLISSLGDLTDDACKIFIDAAVKNPSTQTVCYESIKRFRKPPAFSTLESTLKLLDQALERLELGMKQSGLPLRPLITDLQNLQQALISIKSPRKHLEQGLKQVETVLNQLSSGQKELKNVLEVLQPALTELKPYLEQWEPALRRLVKYLQSPSINKRWAAALFLERLTQCSVVSAYRVQDLLISTIEDSTSDVELWLPKDDDPQSSYECAGSLKQMLSKLLMRMSLIDERSSKVNVSQTKNRLLEDSDAAETSAQLSKCINVDEDSDDAENEFNDSNLSDVEETRNTQTRGSSSQVVKKQ